MKKIKENKKKKRKKKILAKMSKDHKLEKQKILNRIKFRRDLWRVPPKWKNSKARIIITAETFAEYW